MLPLLAACAPDQQQQPKIETEEIGGDPTAALTVEPVETATAATAEPTLTGLLPSDFPQDLPVYRPSSVHDFGEDDQGPFVVLSSVDDPVSVETRSQKLVEEAGWTTAGKGAFSKAGRQIQLTVTRDEDSRLTHIRWYYPRG